MKHLSRRLLYLSAVLWLLSIMFPLASPAWAEIDGNCGATFKGVDVSGLDSGKESDAIDVADNEVVAVNMTSSGGFASHEIKLEIAGVSRTISSQTDDGDTQWSDTVNVKDYAWMGAGLYKVSGNATLTDGSTCSGAALINVDRFPLTTVAGGVATAGTVVGLMAVVSSAGAAVREGGRTSAKIEDWVGNQLEKAANAPPAGPKPEPEWTIFDEIMALFSGPFGPCLMIAIPGLILTGVAMVTPQSDEPTGGRRLPRARWLPRFTVAGVLGGLLAGLGVAVLLQQFAVMPLTLTLLIECLVVGVIIGIVLPSIGKLWSVLRVNATVRNAEQRLRAAVAAPPAAPPQMPPEAQP